MYYRMAKIYFHINQCDASLQYCAILHAVRETRNTKTTFTLIFICKNKRCSTMQQSLRQKRLSHNIYQLTKKFSHTIKQLIPQNFGCVQY